LPTIVLQMATQREIRMTDAEITAACTQLALPRPGTLPGLTPPEDFPDDRAMSPPEPWEIDLLTTLAQPDAVVFAHHKEGGSPVEIRVYAVRPQWAAEQVPGADGVYALALFEAAEVIDRVSEFCHLQDRTTSDARQCEVSGSAFLKAMEEAAASPTRAAGVLRSDGLAAADAGALAAVLSTRERMAQVTVLRRPDPGLLEGSTVAWFDSGPGGLWQVVAPKLATTGDYGADGEGLLDAALVAIGPTTKEELIAEIERGFPG
jgi:hypothetical protein